MLQSRHTRRQSHQPSLAPSASSTTVLDTGIVQWSRTENRACYRLLPTLQPILNRGENFTGVAGDAYGLLLSNDSAFIFPYSNTSSVPPILTFPLPQGEDKLLGALIPGPTHEPGLLVVMPTSGRVGYWPALHSALAPTSGIEYRISLGSNESVIHLCNAGAAGLVLATSSGRLMHVSLRDSVGKATVNVTNMSIATGWLGALKNVATRKEIVAVKAGAAQSREERQVHSITKHGGLTIWEVARGGNYRAMLDCDLWPLLITHDVSEVLDVVAYPVEANSILLLARTNSQTTRILVIQFSSDMQPSVQKTLDLPSLESPRIYLPNPGHIAFVQTQTSVHLIQVANDTVEAVILQPEVNIVAVGIEDQLKNKRNPGLILLTDGAGVIRIETFFGVKSVTNPTKARLEQAIFFGTIENNPISFMPPPKNSDSMVRELSHEILNGTSSFLTRSVSQRNMLQARVSAMEALIRYAAPVAKMTTLQVLREHVEKVVAGEALWTSVDARVEGSSIIEKLVPIVVQDGTKPASDKVRQFFLYGLDRISEIVKNGHRACVEAAAVLENQALSAVVLETNEIILAILITATQYRDQHGSESGDVGEKWTSATDIMQATTVQLSICLKLVAGLKKNEVHDLQNQICGLVAINCRLHEDYLHCTPSSSSGFRAVTQRYLKSRPEWLKDLVVIGRVDKALEIGEQFKDFQTLIEICHDQGETAKDEDIVNSVVRRLEWYLHTFKYEFATILWKYYITHRQFWNLLHEFPNYREYLTHFFNTHDYPSISWMNHVILGDYMAAGTTLLAIPETRIEKRKIQLSIAKLALLVDNDVLPESIEQQMQSSLIMDSLKTELTDYSRDAIDTVAALELCSDQIIPSSCGDDRRNLLRRHLNKLIQGEILTIGEAIDYLTSKATPSFTDALRLLSLSIVPSAVETFLEQLIWRRCYISDDWVKITDTTGQSDATVEAVTANTNLYKTIKYCIERPFKSPRKLLLPKDSYFADHQVVPMPGLSGPELAKLKKEYGQENEALDRYEALADLPTWQARIIQVAGESSLDHDEDEYVRVERPDDDVFMEG